MISIFKITYKGLLYLFLTSLLLGIVSCTGGSGGGGNNPPSPSSLKAMTTFSINSNAGVITGNNIAVALPYGTKVTSLIATFSTTGQSVTVNGVAQVSGQSANNFTNPLIYTVTAADGSS